MSTTLSIRISVAVVVVTMGCAGGAQAQTSDSKLAWNIFAPFTERHPARNVSASLFGADLPVLRSAIEEPVAPPSDTVADPVVPLVASQWPAPLGITLPAYPRGLQKIPRQATAVAPQGLGGSVSARRPALLLSLYGSFGVLQGLDIHSTLRGLSNGAVEANPIMRSVSSNRSVFLTTKVATAALTVVLVERLWRRHRAASIGMMIALNGVYAAVVANNYRVGRR